MSHPRQLPADHKVRYVHDRTPCAIKPDDLAILLADELRRHGVADDVVRGVVAKCRRRVRPRGGRTIARIVDPTGQVVAEADAKCRPDENYNKAIGRQAAFGRALKALLD